MFIIQGSRKVFNIEPTVGKLGLQISKLPLHCSPSGYKQASPLHIHPSFQPYLYKHPSNTNRQHSHIITTNITITNINIVTIITKIKSYLYKHHTLWQNTILKVSQKNGHCLGFKLGIWHMCAVMTYICGLIGFHMLIECENKKPDQKITGVGMAGI